MENDVIRNIVIFYIAITVAALLPSVASADCVSVNRQGRIADYFYNNCGRRIYLRWNDQGICSNGCAVYISSGGYQSVNKLKGNVTWRWVAAN